VLCAAEEAIIVMKETWEEDPPFTDLYKVPPAKVRHPEPDFGIGTFVRVDGLSGAYVYEFQNGDLVEV
jgi:hypothetical protein